MVGDMLTVLSVGAQHLHVTILGFSNGEKSIITFTELGIYKFFWITLSVAGLLHINLFYFPIKIFPMKIYNICTFQEKAELIWTDLFLKRECHRWDHHH